ncbi:Plakophilin-2 [Liparis tanakae]|uniref:Plakophilin-2 n=1 Tax=Liparis tanakae TaxID=230148 RepID=A0A4Z2IBY3_9TELE|nr:Plakophilin-2 [Liparis tanakae]
MHDIAEVIDYRITLSECDGWCRFSVRRSIIRSCLQVYYLRGIRKLLPLLSSDNEEVQCAAAGALRNVVYQSSENKMEVKENSGLATVSRVLKSSRNLETRRELTGLLWNLSSHDLLKECLTREALLVLTQSVLVPSSGIFEGENPKDELLADADAFHNATGCLRNLSSAGPDGRKAMRECENFIDSLVYYIRGAVADYKTNDKSTENCVCILHNLSYQIEAELPHKYSVDLRQSQQNLSPKEKSVGCFAYRGAKITEHLARKCPLLEEKANPRGIEWLWSSITIRMYLSLMARSVRHQTQEAAIGALQNITAGNGPMTEAIVFSIVQRENGLQHVRKMLEDGERNVKRTAISLIKNLSRYRELHPDIVKQVLPEVVGMLPNDDTATDLPTEVTASLCHILNNLSQSDTQHAKAVLNQGALRQIINISSKDSGYGPTRAGQAACVLLHTLWKQSDLHGAYKKCGYRKGDFVNARTTKAVNSR